MNFFIFSFSSSFPFSPGSISFYHHNPKPCGKPRDKLIADITASLQAILERATIVCRANGADVFKRKVGAGIVTVRRAGAIQAFNAMNAFFLINQMIVVGSIYWNVGIGRNVGEVNSDVEGVQTMKTLRQNMAWLLKKTNL